MAYKTNFLGNLNFHLEDKTINLLCLTPDNECLGILASFAAIQSLLNTYKLQKHVMTNTLQERKIKVIDTKKIYTGVVSLRLDRFVLGDKIIKNEIVEHVHSVGLIPIIDNLDVLFVSQYRHAAGKTLLEIPAGKIEKGETPEKAALREMAEEIGYTGKLQSLLKMYLAPGYDTELMHVYVATDLIRIKRAARDDDENIRIKRISLCAAIEKCINGELEDCKSIAAILAYAKVASISK